MLMKLDTSWLIFALVAVTMIAYILSLGLDAANRLHDRLFRAYFTEGANIADAANLIDWAVEAGADRDLAAEAVASNAGRAQVAADLDAAAERQITAVPTFVTTSRSISKTCAAAPRPPSTSPRCAPARPATAWALARERAPRSVPDVRAAANRPSSRVSSA